MKLRDKLIKIIKTNNNIRMLIILILNNNNKIYQNQKLIVKIKKIKNSYQDNTFKNKVLLDLIMIFISLNIELSGIKNKTIIFTHQKIML